MNEKARLVACALFTVSFPTFYYGAIGYLDPVFVLFVAVSLHLILSQKWLTLCILTVLAAGVKESAGIVLVPAAAALYVKGELFRRDRLILLIATVAAYLVVYKAYQNWLLGSHDYQGWNVSFEYVKRNFGRVRSWASILLVFGPVGLIALMAPKWAQASIRLRRQEMTTLYAGMIATVLLGSYTMIGSLADGRTIWSMYPFAVPLAGIAIDGFMARRIETSRPKT